MQRLKDEIHCESPQLIEQKVFNARNDIEKKMYGLEDKLDTQLNGASIFQKLNDFLDNPRVESFNSIIPFLKKYTQLYTTKGKNDFTQISNKALDGMKGYFSKFLNTLHEVLKASKDLKLHMSLKNLNDKDLKLEFNGMKLTLTSTFSMEMDFQLDIQYLYKQYPTKKRNIKNLNHLFTFYFLNYEQILKYLYFFEYRNYCSRFGHFDEVEEYWPASSEMNSINDGPIIEPYYHMRLMAVFNYSEYHRKDVSKVIMYRVGLNFDNGLMEKVMNDVASTKNEILHYIHTVNAFLRSNNIQVSKLLADSEFPGVQKMSYFFHHSFKTTLKEISDEHIQLKKHLYTYFNSLPIFFNEVQVGLKVLDLNHEEGKITESYFSKKMHFELRLQENDALFVEWGPVLNPILFEKALESANENEKTLLENVLLVLKGFPTFQRNYVKKLFLDIWVDSYRLAKKNWAL